MFIGLAMTIKNWSRTGKVNNVSPQSCWTSRFVVGDVSAFQHRQSTCTYVQYITLTCWRAENWFLDLVTQSTFSIRSKYTMLQYEVVIQYRLMYDVQMGKHNNDAIVQATPVITPRFGMCDVERRPSTSGPRSLTWSTTVTVPSKWFWR